MSSERRNDRSGKPSTTRSCLEGTKLVDFAIVGSSFKMMTLKISFRLFAKLQCRKMLVPVLCNLTRCFACVQLPVPAVRIDLDSFLPAECCVGFPSPGGFLCYLLVS
ncbi:hypothetical protein KIL84_010757 [Mauremys mutica]|uniref:Uncharacterized protein n=1 Tax=Mauremys mutica TaxID=74926 RepID=A0A9D3XD79_9SAUR|nr:hypothetical protein KIL84_010757 [Mauremys mutica]